MRNNILKLFFPLLILGVLSVVAFNLMAEGIPTPDTVAAPAPMASTDSTAAPSTNTAATPKSEEKSTLASIVEDYIVPGPKSSSSQNDEQKLVLLPDPNSEKHFQEMATLQREQVMFEVKNSLLEEKIKTAELEKKLSALKTGGVTPAAAGMGTLGGAGPIAPIFPGTPATFTAAPPPLQSMPVTPSPVAPVLKVADKTGSKGAVPKDAKADKKADDFESDNILKGFSGSAKVPLHAILENVNTGHVTKLQVGSEYKGMKVTKISPEDGVIILEGKADDGTVEEHQIAFKLGGL